MPRIPRRQRDPDASVLVAEPPTRPAAPAACPRCGAELAAEQSWCTECGLAARTRLAPAPRWRVPLAGAGGAGLLALAALIVAFVVITANNDNSVPAKPKPQATTPAPPGTDAQAARLRRCLGSPASLVPVFAPTVGYAKAQGGAATAARFGSQKVELLVFPTPQAAQVGFRDAQDQLIQLQQQRPASFTRLAAKMQVVGNVLQIYMRGALPPGAQAKVDACTNAGR